MTAGAGCDYTPTEPFTRTPKVGHPYAAALEWAVNYLGTGNKAMLVIGSTLHEALALNATDYLDWREVPWSLHTTLVHQASVLAMPFADESFDAISSTCVYCHVGLGRYGDPVQDDAELTMLRECRRVLRKGGRVAMMTGPVIQGEPVTVSTTHRVTTLEAFAGQVAEVGRWFDGLSLVTHNAYVPREKRWRLPGEPWSADATNPDYLCVALEAV